MHGFLVTGFLFLYLVPETGRLFFWIIELGESIGQFASAEKKFETIGYKGIFIVTT